MWILFQAFLAVLFYKKSCQIPVKKNLVFFYKREIMDLSYRPLDLVFSPHAGFFIFMFFLLHIKKTVYFS